MISLLWGGPLIAIALEHPAHLGWSLGFQLLGLLAPLNLLDILALVMPTLRKPVFWVGLAGLLLAVLFNYQWSRWEMSLLAAVIAALVLLFWHQRLNQAWVAVSVSWLLVQVIPPALQLPLAQFLSPTTQPTPALLLEKCHPPQRPDIWIIMLDGLAHPSTPIPAFFDLGFTFGPVGESPYQFTIHALAALMSGTHPPTQGTTIHQRKIIQEAQLLQEFKNLGYTVVNIRSGWNFDSHLTQAHQNLGSPFGGDLIGYAFPRMAQRAGIRQAITKWDWSKKMAALKIAHNLTTPTEDQPRAIFWHWMLPHPPYIVDQHGNFRPEGSLTHKGRWDPKEHYFQQSHYVLQSIEDLLGRLQLAKTMVVILGDHGPRFAGQEFSRSAFQATNLHPPFSAEDWEMPNIGRAVLKRLGCSTTPSAPTKRFKTIFFEKIFYRNILDV